MKIITFYLPQFHEIKENNEWWGKGFTEWTNVKKAKPLFTGHNQPRIPENNNYYNLLNVDTIKWQADLAKKAGIYGFCFYHYWFDGHLLLEKPIELFLKNPEIDINFCLSWANEDWTNAWVSTSNKTLISQTYGNKEQWKDHFDYLLKFFKDNRYIKEKGKPIFVIYRPEIIPCCNEMLDYWQELAKEAGLPGIKFAYQHVNFGMMKDKDDTRFDYQIEYQPQYSKYINASLKKGKLYSYKQKIDIFLQKYFHVSLDLSALQSNKGPNQENYDYIWKSILNQSPISDKSIPGAFVDWDNTPRRGSRGSLMVGVTPEKFGAYLKEQMRRSHLIYKKDMLFLFAWNEWAEGGYLEPDLKNGNKYLKGIRKAVDEYQNEFGSDKC